MGRAHPCTCERNRASLAKLASESRSQFERSLFRVRSTVDFRRGMSRMKFALVDIEAGMGKVSTRGASDRTLSRVS
jgi:hypothetical protein